MKIAVNVLCWRVGIKNDNLYLKSPPDELTVPGRGWLDRPKTGFGPMRAAASYSDLSRTAEHLSLYDDEDEDEDLTSSAYLALNNNNGSHDDKQPLANEQSQKMAAGGVLNGANVHIRSSNSQSSSYHGNYMSSSYTTDKRTETARLDTSTNSDYHSDDVDSLIVPVPPSFADVIPVAEVPKVPPPPAVDDLEGEVVPISLKEYASGSDSVRSRKSTRSSEGISTFFAPPSTPPPPAPSSELTSQLPDASPVRYV